MAETIYVDADVTRKTMRVVFGETDFLELVEEKIGCDARRYIESVLAERDMKIRILEETLKELEESDG